MQCVFILTSEVIVTNLYHPLNLYDILYKNYKYNINNKIVFIIEKKLTEKTKS